MSETPAKKVRETLWKVTIQWSDAGGYRSALTRHAWNREPLTALTQVRVAERINAESVAYASVENGGCERDIEVDGYGDELEAWLPVGGKCPEWSVRCRRNDDVHPVELQLHPFAVKPGTMYLYLTREEAVLLAAKLLSATEDEQP